MVSKNIVESGHFLHMAGFLAYFFTVTEVKNELSAILQIRSINVNTERTRL